MKTEIVNPDLLDVLSAAAGALTATPMASLALGALVTGVAMHWITAH